MKKQSEEPKNPPTSNATSSSNASREFLQEQLEEATILLKRADEDRIEPEEEERQTSFQKLRNAVHRAIALTKREAAVEQQFDAALERVDRLEANKEHLTREKKQKESAIRNITMEQRQLKANTKNITLEKQKLEAEARILRLMHKQLEEEHKKKQEDVERAKKELALIETAQQQAEALLKNHKKGTTSTPPAMLTQHQLATTSGNTGNTGNTNAQEPVNPVAVKSPANV